MAEQTVLGSSVLLGLCMKMESLSTYCVEPWSWRGFFFFKPPLLNRLRCMGFLETTSAYTNSDSGEGFVFLGVGREEKGKNFLIKYSSQI